MRRAGAGFIAAGLAARDVYHDAGAARRSTRAAGSGPGGPANQIAFRASSVAPFQ